jgi:ferredoxin--NADP+ reductase
VREVEQVTNLVAVIGAGPAGIYASKELAEHGVHVALFNRDIKPGGLAEYGIYPTKTRMKQSLRRHFWEILKSPYIRYFGNVIIGEEGDLSLDDLRAMGFQALLVTVGAQGTKWLGLPGEDLQGVFHAKDIVYHYNQLPPFSELDYAIGKRAALIGVGNVMVDIAHWLIRERKIDQVIAVARRGPAEVKFTKKEMQYVVANLDRVDLELEMARVVSRMMAVGQDVDAAQAFILSALPKAEPPVSDTIFQLEFLASPSRIIGDPAGRVAGLEVEDTELALRNGGTKAVRLGTYRVLDVDTVIFCIGDRVDPTLGLPVAWNEFVKNPEPRFPIDGVSYEVFDPMQERVLADVFVAGWARQASSGLVGVARKDGVAGARTVLQYLETLPPAPAPDLTNLKERIEALDEPVVSVEKYQRLQWYEWAKADRLGVEDFKFSTNEEMLEVMRLTAEEAGQPMAATEP